MSKLQSAFARYQQALHHNFEATELPSLKLMWHTMAVSGIAGEAFPQNFNGCLNGEKHVVSTSQKNNRMLGGFP